MRRYVFVQLFFLYVMMCYLPPIPISFWINFITGIFLVIFPLRFWIFPIGFVLSSGIREMIALLIMNPKAGYDVSREVARIVLNYSLSKSNLSELMAMKFEAEFWLLFEKEAIKYEWGLYYGPLILIDLIFPLISIAVFYLIARWLIKNGRGIKQLLK